MVILGLGSNVGDRLKHLSTTVTLLRRSVLAAIEMSPIYETKAVLKDGSPDQWSNMFLNMAVVGETHLSPSDLLKKIKMIEKEVGRQDRGIWAPREIDIDILAYNDLVVENDELVIPHKHLYTRPFALVPLADIAPNWQCPVDGAFRGKTAYEMVNQLFVGSADIKKSDHEIRTEEILV